MNNDKINCSSVAKNYSKIIGMEIENMVVVINTYQEDTVAEKLIKTYKLNSNSKILDAGCGKGFLLKEIKDLLPKINVTGFDISKYAIKNSHLI